MTQIDDDGLVNLFAGVTKQAVKDVNGDDPKAAVDAAKFLAEWQAKFDDLERRADALINGKVAPKAAPKAAPAPVALSAAEIADNARKLVDLGIDPKWAAIQANPAKLAERNKLMAKMERAAALGVDYRYLPEEETE